MSVALNIFDYPQAGLDNSHKIIFDKGLGHVLILHYFTRKTETGVESVYREMLSVGRFKSYDFIAAIGKIHPKLKSPWLKDKMVALSIHLAEELEKV